MSPRRQQMLIRCQAARTVNNIIRKKQMYQSEINIQEDGLVA